MLYIGDRDIPDSDDHEGFITARGPDGSYTTIWTDVCSLPVIAVTRYAAACECGWRGPDHPPTAHGYRAAQTSFREQHFLLYARHAVPHIGSVGPAEFLYPSAASRRPGNATTVTPSRHRTVVITTRTWCPFRRGDDP